MVSLLERERKYQEAVISLRWILNVRPRLFGYRRGRVWERLAIDLEHLKEYENVRDVCKSALCDDIVSGGEYLSLEHRLLRVSDMLKKKKKKTKKKITIEENDDSADDFVDDFVLTKNNKRRSVCDSKKKKKKKRKRKKKKTEENIKSKSMLSTLTESLRIVRFTIRPLNRRAGEKSRFVSLLDKSDSFSTCDSVESVALQHYEIKEHFQGLHVEGRLCRALFGLLLWDDVLFRDCENVFFTAHQDCPSDLHGRPGEFVKNRQDALLCRLSEISKMKPETIVTELSKSWKTHFGSECQGVRWPAVQHDDDDDDDHVMNSDMNIKNDPIANLSVLQCAAVCIGGDALSAIFLRLAWNFSHFSGGMPDLFLWRVEIYDDDIKDWKPWAGSSLNSLISSSPSSTIQLPDDERVRYMSAFVEVKGPRDNLSPRQVLWLKILESEAHLRAEVCRVDEP